MDIVIVTIPRSPSDLVEGPSGMPFYRLQESLSIVGFGFGRSSNSTDCAVFAATARSLPWGPIISEDRVANFRLMHRHAHRRTHRSSRRICVVGQENGWEKLPNQTRQPGV